MNISNKNLRDSENTTGVAEEAGEEDYEDNDRDQENERKNLKKNHKLPCNRDRLEIKPEEAAESCDPRELSSHCRARLV